MSHFMDLPFELQEQIWHYALPDVTKALIPYHDGLWRACPLGPNDVECGCGGVLDHGGGQCMKIVPEVMPKLRIDLRRLEVCWVCRHSHEVVKAWLKREGFATERASHTRHDDTTIHYRTFKPGQDILYIRPGDWEQFAWSVFDFADGKGPLCVRDLDPQIRCFALPFAATTGSTNKCLDDLWRVCQSFEFEDQILMIDEQGLPEFDDPTAPVQPLWTVEERHWSCSDVDILAKSPLYQKQGSEAGAVIMQPVPRWSEDTVPRAWLPRFKLHRAIVVRR